MKTIIVITAKNEEKTIAEVVKRSLRYGDVCVTDDGSRDQTPIILKQLRKQYNKNRNLHKLFIITHKHSTHIPKGIQDGLKFGLLKNYNYFITMDAGLSHNPDEIPKFIKSKKSYDVVIGKREKVKNVPFYRKGISKVGSFLVNYTLTRSYFKIYKPRIYDCTSGFRCYSKKAAKKIASTSLRSKAFDFHMEALALCVRAGMSVSEIPITYIFSNSSFNLRILWLAIKYTWYLFWTKQRVIKEYIV